MIIFLILKIRVIKFCVYNIVYQGLIAVGGYVREAYKSWEWINV